MGVAEATLNVPTALSGRGMPRPCMRNRSSAVRGGALAEPPAAERVKRGAAHAAYWPRRRRARSSQPHVALCADLLAAPSHDNRPGR